MNIRKHAPSSLLSLFLCFGVLLCASRTLAVIDTASPVINSISVVGTNLDFVATLPAGVASGMLEMRPTLEGTWQSAATLNIPPSGGMVEFLIPMPAWPSAFFRLNIMMQATTNTSAASRISEELQFVAVPPLGPDSANTNEAVFHFKGMVDGSDRIIIRRQGALWEHRNWAWPRGAVTVNGAQWNPSEINYMTTTGAVPFLPEKYDLLSPRLELITNRDVVTLERTNDALIIYLDDTPPGAALNEFKIHFPLVSSQPKPEQASPEATLKIAAVIDGSDLLKITATEATWKHRAWGKPRWVTLNDVSWNLWQTNVLSNTGTNRFLPEGVDFSTAKIVKRQGRDLATMWSDDGALWINFADNPNGADAYELDISFGH